MEYSKLEMEKIALHKWLKNFVTTVKKDAKEENVHTSIVFCVIIRFRKGFSIEWEEQKKIEDQEQRTKLVHMYSSPTSKIHVSRNVIL